MSNPSLILPQSPAYGEDYVYAAQVEDGAVPLYNVLPLTFTRASGGTRINKDALVQNMPYNLLGYSEDFTNGVWALSNVTITANAIANPINGQTNAELATCASGSSISPNIYYQTSFAATNGQVYNYSYYAKKGGSNFAKIRFSGSAFASVTNSPIFNLNTGVVVSGTGTIESVGNGWYRISASATAEANASAVVTIDIPSSTGVWPNGNFTGAESIYIFGAQVNIGSTAQPYLATTDRLNMPRITYPVGGGCGALLLEKQSTNIVTYSEDATQQGLSNMSASANTAISPDGTQNADTITPSAGISDHYLITNATSVSSGVNFTASVFVKKKGYDYLYFGTGGDASFGAVRYQFSTNTFFGIAGPSIYSATNFGNGWVRLIIGGTTGGTDLRILITPSDSTGNRTFDSNGTDGLYVWGLQIEASSYATSYIPTTSTSATRIADSCYKTGISNLIGQTEGTLFAEIVRTQSTANDLFWITLSDGSINNWLFFGTEGTGGRFYVRASNTVIFDQYPAISLGRHKLALAYKSGSIAVYIDGAQLFTSSSTFTIGSLTGFALGQNQSTLTGSVDTSGQVNQAILFPTRLTNAELATLTTL